MTTAITMQCQCSTNLANSPSGVIAHQLQIYLVSPQFTSPIATIAGAFYGTRENLPFGSFVRKYVLYKQSNNNRCDDDDDDEEEEEEEEEEKKDNEDDGDDEDELLVLS